jgi:hypothetical protein
MITIAKIQVYATKSPLPLVALKETGLVDVLISVEVIPVLERVVLNTLDIDVVAVVEVFVAVLLLEVVTDALSFDVVVADELPANCHVTVPGSISLTSTYFEAEFQ